MNIFTYKCTCMAMNHNDVWDIMKSYLKYVEACSQALRMSFKEEFRPAAMRRSENGLKMAKWEAGKQGESSRFKFL